MTPKPLATSTGMLFSMAWICSEHDSRTENARIHLAAQQIRMLDPEIIVEMMFPLIKSSTTLFRNKLIA